ncbi:MAG: flagellar assembly protein FliW [Lachnospiraceae bacterium]|nr:flagellar assembly protein FliW [Lachnospiraceae bacterium]
MNINAKYFGSISYEENQSISVPGGLIGFEAYTRYLPIPFQEEDDSMISLQSLDDETLSFILMNPFRIFPDYTPEISGQDLRELGAESPDDISYYVVSTIRETVAGSTVNLKAPLAVNALNRRAKQIILDQPEYTFRHALGSTNHKEGE